MVPRGSSLPLPLLICLQHAISDVPCPLGNTYLIENISDRNARLFFTQARKVAMNDEERAAKAAHDAETYRRKSLARSPSTSLAKLGTTPAPDARATSIARRVS